MINGFKARCLRRLSVVPRWAVIPTIQKQTVDAHSFHTVWIYMWVREQNCLGQPTVDEIMDVLAHDHQEAITGDLPTPTKKSVERDLSLHEATMKVADCLEASLFLMEERRLGNGVVQPIADDVIRRGAVSYTRLRKAAAIEGKVLVYEFEKLRANLIGMCDPGAHVVMESET